jgi:hypothetical protein
MKEFWRKNNEAIMIIVFLIVLGVSVKFVILPLYHSVNSERDSIQKEILLQQSKKDRIQKIPDYKKQTESILKNKKQFDVFISEKNALTLIERIEAVAQKCGVEIKIEIAEKTISAPVQKKKDGADKKKEGEIKTLVEELPADDYMSLKILTTGDFKGVYSFLKKMEAMDYMSDVISFSIRQAQEEDEAKAVQTTLGVQGGTEVKVVETPVSEPKEKLESTIDMVFYYQVEEKSDESKKSN